MDTTYEKVQTEKSSMKTSSIVNRDLDELDQKGFVILKNALSPAEVSTFKDELNRLRMKGEYDGTNIVGNMYFNRLLELNPSLFSTLIAHPSLKDHLDELFGAQCQVRSYRGHINPGEYKQEWHLDFYDYWTPRKGRYSAQPVGINTTFYLTDDSPEAGSLTFVTGGHKMHPKGLLRTANPYDENNEFHHWCESQETETIYPQAGDAVIFFSHIPHRGMKKDAKKERSNLVVHYQVTPMYEGIWHVSEPMGFYGTFPLAPKMKTSEKLKFYSSRVLSRSFLNDLVSILRRLVR